MRKDLRKEEGRYEEQLSFSGLVSWFWYRGAGGGLLKKSGWCASSKLGHAELQRSNTAHTFDDDDDDDAILGLQSCRSFYLFSLFWSLPFPLFFTPLIF